MAKRHQPSSIDKLPDAVRETIGRLRQEGRTIDEILAKLQELDVDVSRSALGRHVKTLAAIGEQMRRSKAIATAMVERFGAEPDHKVTRLNIEMLQGSIFQILLAAAEAADQGDNAEGGTSITLGPKDVMQMSKALGDLTRAAATDADRVRKMKSELAKEAAEAAGSAAKAKGISADTVQAIMHAVLGVAA